jgi:hypothetical protein
LQCWYPGRVTVNENQEIDRPFAVGFNMKRMTHGFKLPASAFDRSTHAQPRRLSAAAKLENDTAEVLQSDAEQRCLAALLL